MHASCTHSKAVMDSHHKQRKGLHVHSTVAFGEFETKPGLGACDADAVRLPHRPHLVHEWHDDLKLDLVYRNTKMHIDAIISMGKC